jgi:bacillithiol synthase
LEQQVSVEPFGGEIIGILRSCYKIGDSIQLATFRIVHQLFNNYGLIVLIADDSRLKSQMKKIFEDDLFYQKPSEIVEASCNRLAEHYNVQANPREINQSYLKDSIRERIEKENDEFKILNSDIRFTVNELKEELEKHPERFSPNVILRGLYQESILPNICFIGGGGELAYWLQLKDLFQHYFVVYPALILRNSFIVVDAKWQARMNRLGLTITDLFMTEAQIMRKIVQKFSDKPVSLNGNFEKAELLFEEIRRQAELIDPTLSQHITAIKTQSIKTLHELEKKMLRAEKRKFTDQQRQTFKIKQVLFPKNALQERIENICTFYPKWGRSFIDQLHAHSLSTEQLFTILIDQNN